MTTGSDELLALAAHCARTAGDAALRGRRTAGIRHAHTKSSPVDVVTEFDRAAERQIIEGLLDARPHDGIVGEEGSSHSGSSGVVWHVDPIDGTTNFLYDLPLWAVSIAATEPDGEGFNTLSTVAGVVYVPATAEMFTATRGGGAALDGRPVSCSPTTDLALALVATGLPYRRDRREAVVPLLADVIRHTRDLRRMGSASIDLCAVAAGRADAYFEQWLSSWDIAAGELIVREAGGRTMALDGGPPTPESLLACTPGIAEAMLTLIGAARAN